MKKYFQISFFLGIFTLLVVFRQLKGSESAPVVGNNVNLNSTVAPTNTPVPSQAGPSPVASSPTSTPILTPKPKGLYRDGNYTGSVEDAFYGNIQVQAKILGGRIVDVVFLQAPNDNRTSISINSQADPMLTQEAIAAQSANVNIISGASASSQAFQASLANALAQAKN